MKKNNKGFSLIEILAVIIILGILLIITIPAVSKYILSSNKASYAADIVALLETMKAEYDMKEYGSFVKEGEIMIVPFRYVTLEKGTNLSSPFGDYDLKKSYGIIVPERNGYQMYANVTDNNGMGVSMKSYNEMDKSVIQDGISSSFLEYDQYLGNTTTDHFSFGGYSYKECSRRQIKKDSYSDANVYILCKE